MSEIAAQRKPAGNVLLVDDSEVVAGLVGQILGREGWSVRMATSGIEACRLVADRAPEVVVCDLHMPDMDGLEVIARLRELDGTLPVVMLSSDHDLSAVLQAVRQGAFDYVVKSRRDFGSLVLAVERAAEHCRVLRDNQALQEALAAANGALAERLAHLQREVKRREAAQRALKQARDAALAASQAKSAFLANMSHELRTPLNAILGYAELVRETLEAESVREGVEDVSKIEASGKHLLSLINDILDLAKIEAGRANVFAEQVDLMSVCESVISAVWPQAARKGIALELEQPVPDMVVNIDVRKVRQCLINLAANACKFTAEGGVSLSVAVDGSGMLAFAVRDTGIGMSAEQRRGIFEAFAQADASTTRKYGGTGLGLAITSRLAQLMGGRIEVESEMDAGSTFTLFLPSDVSRLAEPTPEVTAKITPSPQPRSVILGIGPDPRVLRQLRLSLEDDHTKVLLASSGPEAVLLAQRHRPEAVCLDLLLEEPSGWDVLKTMKGDPLLTRTPIILASVIDDGMRGLALQAVDHLIKPVSRQSLERALLRAGCKPPGPALIVDSSVSQREILERLLASEGWETEQAATCADALTRARRRPPGVVIADITDPSVSGYELLSALTRAELAHVPLLAMCATNVPPSQKAYLDERVRAVVRRDGADAEHTMLRLRELVRAALVHR